jgi:RNA polymerase sigma-70 factor (ECF subfamily)
LTQGSGDKDVRELIIDAMPSLRAFARTLANDRDRADDLVQETVVKALSNLDRFQAGTNIRAWLFTILRNHFFSELRKHRRETADVDGKHAAQLTSRATQLDKVEINEFRQALLKLSTEQREALILVGPAGFSYEAAADICHCAVGTIKSRVNRARKRLMEMLEGETVREKPRQTNVA